MFIHNSLYVLEAANRLLLFRCNQVVNDAFGIESGLMTTVHSTTGASLSRCLPQYVVRLCLHLAWRIRHL